MRIHILGSDGFVGKRLMVFFSGIAETRGYSLSDCDLLSLESVSNLPKFTEQDVVIMVSSITRLKENSLESMEKNILMADNISKFIKENPPGYFVFLSTIDVYGANPQIPVKETNFPNPSDYYSLSKLASEFLLRKVCAEKDIPLLILRLSGLYGKGDEGKSTINKLFESAVRDRKITIIGDGSDTRDFVYVEDVCKLIWNGILQKKDSLVNVATGESYSINEIVNLLRQYLSYGISIEYKEESGQKRAKELRFDNSLLKKNFPWFEFTNLKNGLKLYFETPRLTEINLMERYPQSKRNPDERALEKTEEDRKIAREFGKEFFDGDRKHGYGGYSYHPRFWTDVVQDIIKHYKLTEESSLLDVGCGKGFMLYDFKKALPGMKIRGIDISRYAVENGKEEIKEFLNVGNAKYLGEFKDKEFDLVISTTTIHNLPREECKQAVREIQRVGKNAFVTVDAWRNEEERKRMEAWNLTALTYMHVDDWKKFFEECGYTGDCYWFTP